MAKNTDNSNASFLVRASFANRLGSEKEAVAMTEPIFDQLGVSKERLEDVKTMISEACLNAMEHGNQFDQAASYEVEFCFADGLLSIRVYDRGGMRVWSGIHEFRDIASVMESEWEPRGWGLKLIDSLADSWELHMGESQTCLEICVNLDEGKEEPGDGSRG